MPVRALVVDDRYSERETLYQSLAATEEAGALHLEPASIPLDPEAISRQASRAQVALVDIYLEDTESPQAFRIAGGINILDLLEEVNDHLPVYLVSEYWDRVTLRLYNDLLRRQRVVGGLSIERLSSSSELARVRYEINKSAREASGIANLTLGPNEDLIVLQLGDLQVGGSYAEHSIARLVSDIYDAMPTDEISGEVALPHLVALVGDVAETGHAEEYAAAYELLTQLLDRLNVSRENCILVPGNHDVNLPMACSRYIRYSFSEAFSLEGDTTNPSLRIAEEEKVARYNNGLVPFYDFSRLLTKRDDWRVSYRGDKVGVSTFFENRAFLPYGLNIIGLNTVGFLSPRDPSLARLSSSDIETLVLGLDALCKKHESSPVNLVILHHSPWPGLGDATLGEDGTQLLTRMSRGRGDFVFLFGHIHKSICNFQPFTQGADRQAVYSTSSTVSLSSRKRPEDSLRGFNRLSFRRENDNIIGVKVEVYEFSHGEFSRRKTVEFGRDEVQGWVRAK